MFLFNLFDRSTVNCAAFKTSSCQINLSKNKLQKLDQGALQPILQSFAAGGLNTTTAFINASSSKLIYLSLNSFYDVSVLIA